MANDEITIEDAEFNHVSNDKIDFKSILLKQIDYIRYLRTQDMGEYITTNMGVVYKNIEKQMLWFSNQEKFINSVKTLQSLLITYRDDKYTESIKTIHKDFEDKLNKKLKKLNIHKKQQTHQSAIKNINKKISDSKQMYNLTNNSNKWDLMFEECLMLCLRAKFIGGNDVIEYRE